MTQCRNQARSHDRRLARAGRADHHDTAGADGVAPEALDQFIDEALATEEPIRVAVFERAQTQVRVRNVSVRSRFHGAGSDAMVRTCQDCAGLRRRRIERADELLDRRESVIRILGGRCGDGIDHRLREIGPEVREWRNWVVELILDELVQRRVRRKRQRSGQGLEEHDAKAEDIGFGAERLTPDLLRSCVRRRPLRQCGLGPA